jgi:ABC-type xylose transport system permease subunit
LGVFVLAAALWIVATLLDISLSKKTAYLKIFFITILFAGAALLFNSFRGLPVPVLIFALVVFIGSWNELSKNAGKSIAT